MRVGRDSPEQIRRREVSRALKKINLSPEEEEAIERLSRSLVGKLLHGPISRVMACAEVEFSSVGRPGPEASPGPKTDSKIRENGKPYIQREFKIESDQVFNNPA